jgi:hypothetical protein
VLSRVVLTLAKKLSDMKRGVMKPFRAPRRGTEGRQGKGEAEPTKDVNSRTVPVADILLGGSSDYNDDDVPIVTQLPLERFKEDLNSRTVSVANILLGGSSDDDDDVPIVMQLPNNLTMLASVAAVPVSSPKLRKKKAPISK